jgi:hypothetical protein
MRSLAVSNCGAVIGLPGMPDALRKRERSESGCKDKAGSFLPLINCCNTALLSSLLPILRGSLRAGVG